MSVCLRTYIKIIYELKAILQVKKTSKNFHPKNGRPLKIGENLDKQVMEYVSYIRSTGTAVNTAVVMSCAEGILMHEDASMLSRVDLNKGWAQYLLHRMGFVKRKATTKAKVSVENFAELKSDYLLKIKNIIAMDEIPAELVINFDQTALNIVPTSDWTMEAEGSKRVEIITKDDKRQITAVYWLVHLMEISYLVK